MSWQRREMNDRTGAIFFATLLAALTIIAIGYAQAPSPRAWAVKERTIVILVRAKDIVPEVMGDVIYQVPLIAAEGPDGEIFSFRCSPDDFVLFFPGQHYQITLRGGSLIAAAPVRRK